MAAPKYHVQLWDMTGTGFGPGALITEFNNAKNIGWADYLLDVPEAFFTLHQDDPKAQLIRPYKDGNAHIRIYRDSDLVWGGILGEWDANKDDVVLYGYGYLAAAYLTQSDWSTVWTNQQIDTIVTDEWTRAKTTLTDSLLGWVTTGTIEAPVTTSGGSTAIVLPTYKAFYKRTLFTLRELALIGIGDTTNTVVFEITPSGTFNFWKNKGQDRAITWTLGDGLVANYHEGNVPIFRRNDILGIGINPNDITLRQEVSNSADITANGRRSEPVFFSWVRDSTEMERVMAIRASRALRDDVDITLQFHPGKILPPGATGAGYVLGDRANVVVSKGVTNFSGKYLIRGVQVLYIGGQERVHLVLEQRSGS